MLARERRGGLVVALPPAPVGADSLDTTGARSVLGSQEVTYYEAGARERRRLPSHRRPDATSDSRPVAGWRRSGERARRRFRIEPPRDLEASEGAEERAPGHGRE